MSWPLVKLGDICDLLNGYAFKSSDYVESSNTLSCRMSNIRPGGEFNIDYNARFLPDDFKNKYKKFLLNDGDVIIAMTDLADSPKILGVPTVVKTGGRNILLNQRVGKLVIKETDRVYFPYLKLALNYPKVRSIYKQFAGGGLQINLGKKDLLSVEIPLPPLEEQKRIAAILDKADAIRQKRKQAIELADEFLRSVFLDMFGDPVTNPKGFQIGTIRDIVSTVNYGTSGKASETDGEFPILRMGNITYKGGWDFSDLKYIDLDNKDQGKYLASKNDLLFNRTNSKELVGKTAVFNESKPMAIAGYLIRVRANDLGNPWYISGYLNSSHGKQTLLNMCKSIVGMANINAQELQNIKILLPPVELQNKYESIVKEVNKRVSCHHESVKELQTLFNALSQKAFSGQL
ncbi:TPA: restriction endonuclease subunit S [Photobacterium damselae]|uniref:restriction endonuclease subunit S n=1 Tax=Photobacterium damselae TaxID=38293 RepID=UPI00370CB06B